MLPNKGKDGREVELRKGAYFIQWRYVGEPRWRNLIAIDELRGEKGKAGNSLNLGLAARQVQLRSENGYVQWRWAGQKDWTNLYKIPTGGSGGGGPVDYNDLINKPDLTLKADKNYVDTQDTALTKRIDTGLQGKVNKAGDTMTGNLIVPSVSINGSNFLTGTGFPNGVVAAPVGSIYVDKNLTCGASLWIKQTGNGNTGWRVLSGDTGWLGCNTIFEQLFDSSDLLDTGCKIRRINNTVYFTIKAKVKTISEISVNIKNSGFSSGDTIPQPIIIQQLRNTSKSAQMQITNNSFLWLPGYNGSKVGDRVTCNSSYTTTADWPTTLTF